MKIPGELISLSRYYGSNQNYVIGGGGNTSYKQGDRMWIKASGIPLGSIDRSGFVCLSRSKLDKISTANYSENPFHREQEIKNDLIEAVCDVTRKRPSVETSLHNLLRSPFVVHTHPTIVNAMLCSVDAERVTEEIFGNDVLFVDYINPGYELFKYTESKLVEYRTVFGDEPEVILLRNHGLIVCGETPDDINFRTLEIVNNIEAHLRTELPSTDYISPGGVLKSTIRELEYYFKRLNLVTFFRDNNLIQKFVDKEETFKRSVHPLTPDNVVYCKSQYLFTAGEAINILSDTESFKSRTGYLPSIIAIEKNGLISLGPDKESARRSMDVFHDMIKIIFLSGNFGGPEFLSPEQIGFIDNWEAENYRRSV